MTLEKEKATENIIDLSRRSYVSLPCARSTKNLRNPKKLKPSLLEPQRYPEKMQQQEKPTRSLKTKKQ